MKKDKVKDEFLAQLKKVPIVQVACEKCGISRNSVYRWKNEDEEFRKEMETALAEGEDLVNDMGESQLLSLMREKNWNAIAFWLRKRNPKFRDKLEVTANFERQEELSPEQEAIVQKALQLAAVPTEETEPKAPITDEDHGQSTPPGSAAA